MRADPPADVAASLYCTSSALSCNICCPRKATYIGEPASTCQITVATTSELRKHHTVNVTRAADVITGGSVQRHLASSARATGRCLLVALNNISVLGELLGGGSWRVQRAD